MGEKGKGRVREGKGREGCPQLESLDAPVSLLVGCRLLCRRVRVVDDGHVDSVRNHDGASPPHSPHKLDLPGTALDPDASLRLLGTGAMDAADGGWRRPTTQLRPTRREDGGSCPDAVTGTGS